MFRLGSFLAATEFLGGNIIATSEPVITQPIIILTMTKLDGLKKMSKLLLQNDCDNNLIYILVVIVLLLKIDLLSIVLIAYCNTTPTSNDQMI
jgi:hypothetical protein